MKVSKVLIVPVANLNSYSIVEWYCQSVNWILCCFCLTKTWLGFDEGFTIINKTTRVDKLSSSK